MDGFTEVVRRHMRARGLSLRATAKAAGYDPSYLSKVLNGGKPHTPMMAACLDRALGADGEITAACATPPNRVQDRQKGLVAPGPAPGADDEIAAIELERRAMASDVGDRTCERLELAVDDLATAYPGTPPADLLPRVRSHLGYVTQLLDGRATLTQRRRLMVSGGWLSLLVATVLIDLDQDPAAAAYLRTAAQLAGETGHDEIAAWVLETRAWTAVTAGDYRAAVTLSQGAQRVAPADGSAFIQATGQEGRAWARLGDTRETRGALARVERLAAPLPVPARPEHHFRYDPAKAEAYTATTLSWIGDPAAEQTARDVVARLESPRPRRASSAKLDLALALTGRGKLDEAAGTALQAVTSGYLVPSNYWRAQEVVSEVTARGVPEGRDLAEAYKAVSRHESLPIRPELPSRDAGRREPAPSEDGGPLPVRRPVSSKCRVSEVDRTP